MTAFLLARSISSPFAASIQAQVAADGSVSEAHDGKISMKHHLATIGMHENKDDVHADADAELGSFVDCAAEGGECLCDGVVLFGVSGSDADWRVLCAAASFGASPSSDIAKVCRCYSLKWCQENNVEGLSSDNGHRRRSTGGTLGRNLHQRRRWCGWGPRDCTWSSWSTWSECTGGKTCEEAGVSQRSRHIETDQANGGSCPNQTTSERTSCQWVGCKDATSSASDVVKAGSEKPQAEQKEEMDEHVQRITMTMSAANRSLTAEQARTAAERSAEIVAHYAEAAGVTEEAVSKAVSNVKMRASLEEKLTPDQLGRIAANEFLKVVIDLDVFSVQDYIVSVAGGAILAGLGNALDVATTQVVDAMASKIADDLGFPKSANIVQGAAFSGSGASTTDTGVIAIFPKALAQASQNLEG